MTKQNYSMPCPNCNHGLSAIKFTTNKSIVGYRACLNCGQVFKLVLCGIGDTITIEKQSKQTEVKP